MKVVYLTTWPPRENGIGSFARDLALEIEKNAPEIDWEVIAVDELEKKFNYDKKVTHRFEWNDIKSYSKIAKKINLLDIDLVVVQHEYNLFGKQGGARILTLLKKLNKPCIVILHSLPHPDDRKYKYKKKKIAIIKKMSSYTDKLVTICPAGKERLTKIYDVNAQKIEIIPHGSPDFSKEAPGILKKRLGFENNHLLLNFGFLGRRKGLETVIKAMTEVTSKYPMAKLVFLGGFNPASRNRKDFEIYLKELRGQIKKLKIEKNVEFIEGFIPLKMVLEFYKAADIFVYANTFKSQISSGPLTYAVAAEKAIVSSSFTYAEDVLGNGRGITFPMGNYHSLADSVCKILGDPEIKLRLEKKVGVLGKTFLWKEVAKKYVKLFEKVFKEKK